MDNQYWQLWEQLSTKEYQKPYGWIDMKTYGSLDGEAVIKTAYNLLQNYDA